MLEDSGSYYKIPPNTLYTNNLHLLFTVQEAGKFKVKLITDLVSTDSLSIIDENHYPYLIERLCKLPQTSFTRPEVSF